MRCEELFLDAMTFEQQAAVNKVTRVQKSDKIERCAFVKKGNEVRI